MHEEFVLLWHGVNLKARFRLDRRDIVIIDGSERDFDPKPAPLAVLARHLYFSVHEVDQVPDDEKPQPRTQTFMVLLRIELDERIEQA